MKTRIEYIALMVSCILALCCSCLRADSEEKPYGEFVELPKQTIARNIQPYVALEDVHFDDGRVFEKGSRFWRIHEWEGSSLKGKMGLHSVRSGGFNTSPEGFRLAHPNVDGDPDISVSYDEGRGYYTLKGGGELILLSGIKMRVDESACFKLIQKLFDLALLQIGDDQFWVEKGRLRGSVFSYSVSREHYEAGIQQLRNFKIERWNKIATEEAIDAQWDYAPVFGELSGKEWIIVKDVTLPDGEVLRRGTEVKLVKKDFDKLTVKRGWSIFSTELPRWSASPKKSRHGWLAIGGREERKESY